MSTNLDTAPRCYGYGRHSTIKQEYTQRAQRQRVKSYYRKHLRPKGVVWGGWFYDKATSGSKPFTERERGRAVYCLARPGDHIVVSKLDRPFRSVADGVRVIQDIATRGVAFHSLDLLVDTSTPLGKFFMTVLLAVAELERGFASERTKEVIESRKKRGLPWTRTCPLGWKVVGKTSRQREGKGSTRRFVIDEDERALCEEICRRRMAGEGLAHIALWSFTQKQFPATRSFGYHEAIQWAVAAVALNYPLESNCRAVISLFQECVSKGLMEDFVPRVAACPRPY